MAPLARFRLVSAPPGGQGAISVVEVSGESGEALERALESVGIGVVAAGQWAVRTLGRGESADRGVVARITERTAWLMPHAGPVVVSELLRALAGGGLAALDEPAYPEAASEIEARMLAVLASAPSPLAVDVLLDQPRRWAGLDPRAVVAGADASTLARWHALRRLLEPPIVVAWGGPNIGKSSLLNALAGTPVALAADERGTTRDHVGAALDLAGLVVWYGDTPGVREPADDAEAQAAAAARELASRADLVLLCADSTSGFVEPPRPAAGRAPVILRVALRVDLGPPLGGPGVDHSMSLVVSDGADRTLELARLIRDRLVPPGALSHPGAWAFWGVEGAAGAVGGRPRA